MASGSLPAKRHGVVQTGEVDQEHQRPPGDQRQRAAIAFVKKEADTTDTWVVVFEKPGREFTRLTYYVPEE